MSPVIKIQQKTLEQLSVQAKSSERKRKNFNYHPTFSDPINRMLNAVEPGSYIQPHKHENRDKREVFILIKGKMVVVFFDDEGKIIDHIILDNQENFGVEIPPSVWHTLISLESGTVVYEVKDGPYSPDDDKNFATWAPKEGKTDCKIYLDKILVDLNLL